MVPRMDRLKINQWYWWWLIALSGLIAAGAFYAAAKYLLQRESNVLLTQRETQSRLSKIMREQQTTVQRLMPVAQPIAQQDFAVTGVATLSASSVLKTLTQIAATNDVTVMDMQTQDHPATVSELARAELNLHLRGSYVATKALIQDVQRRNPWVTVQRWSLQRLPAPSTEVESTLMLNFWGRPQFVQ